MTGEAGRFELASRLGYQCDTMPQVKGTGVMQIVGIVLAMGIGLVSWPAALALGGWGSPLRTLDSLLLWAPIVGAAAPIALLLFVKGAKASGAWVVALAPLLGVLNVLWSVDLYTSYLGPSFLSSDPIPWVFMVLSAMWLLPWLYVINALKNETASRRILRPVSK